MRGGAFDPSTRRRCGALIGILAQLPGTTAVQSRILATPPPPSQASPASASHLLKGEELAMKRAFDHVGIPTDVPQPGESWVEHSKVWVTNPPGWTPEPF